MAKRELLTDSIKANYECSQCHKTINDIPVNESIYNGAPLCQHCDKEMELITIYQYEKLLKYTSEKEKVDPTGVHRTHCCILHGCKYGESSCVIANGEIEQEYLCEQCGIDGITTIDELRAMMTLEIRKCTTCGHYYKE